MVTALPHPTRACKNRRNRNRGFMASVSLRQLSITTQDFPTDESGTILVDCIALTAANIGTSLSSGSVHAIGCLVPIQADIVAAVVLSRLPLKTKKSACHQIALPFDLTL
jgi:hypothetical protein